MNDHEDRCDERQADMKKSIDSLKLAAWALAVGLVAWALSQLYSANNSRLDRLEQRPAASATVNMPQAKP